MKNKQKPKQIFLMFWFVTKKNLTYLNLMAGFEFSGMLSCYMPLNLFYFIILKMIKIFLKYLIYS